MANEVFKGLADVQRAAANMARVESFIPQIPPTLRSDNPAKWAHERLGRLVKSFESDLDEEHEIGAKLVAFGGATFHIERVGYWGPDIVTFAGISETGERVELIQNISQLSVLLVAVKKLADKPRRIGFLWDQQR